LTLHAAHYSQYVVQQWMKKQILISVNQSIIHYLQ